LIAGITSGSRLVRNSKLASAAQFTKSSDINSIADLVLWLEPTSDVFFMSVFGNINANNYYDYFNGYIGEVLVFDRALKTEEIDTINKYLSTKWSITLK
jgi:CRISPR/Cas system-associated endonuclease Cas1